MKRYTESGVPGDIRSKLKPHPVLLLLIASLFVLMLAIFVFGAHGKYNNPDLADLLRTIAVGALAAAVTGIVDHTLLFDQIKVRIQECLREYQLSEESIAELGVRTAYKIFDFKRLFEEARSSETISWLDTYCPTQNDFLTAIESALNRGVRVRMLVINPGCENARHRSIELEGRPESGEAFKAGLKVFILHMRQISEKYPGKFLVRFYSDLPCVPMYIVGQKDRPRKAYFSLFLSRATFACSHLELSRGEWLEGMSTYFERKWERWQVPDFTVVLSELGSGNRGIESIGAGSEGQGSRLQPT